MTNGKYAPSLALYDDPTEYDAVTDDDETEYVEVADDDGYNGRFNIVLRKLPSLPTTLLESSQESDSGPEFDELGMPYLPYLHRLKRLRSLKADCEAHPAWTDWRDTFEARWKCRVWLNHDLSPRQSDRAPFTLQLLIVPMVTDAEKHYLQMAFMVELHQAGDLAGVLWALKQRQKRLERIGATLRMIRRLGGVVSCKASEEKLFSLFSPLVIGIRDQSDVAFLAFHAVEFATYGWFPRRSVEIECPVEDRLRVLMKAVREQRLLLRPALRSGLGPAIVFATDDGLKNSWTVRLGEKTMQGEWNYKLEANSVLVCLTYQLTFDIPPAFTGQKKSDRYELDFSFSTELTAQELGISDADLGLCYESNIPPFRPIGQAGLSPLESDIDLPF